ncbi:YheC/YheD family protein [Paenibacillus puerhi]|uniref:YheC/YheD family protein n=1 Tax=Paenibacillus puerhi TaxID=2692622 RepID=UPI001356B3CE|nr:YheC/YheD family protein [Paenibacillus puerhi]
MRKRTYSRHITSKWAKTKALLANPSTARHVPDTRRLTKGSLQEMLRTYGMVYVKPNSGTYGIGVIRVEQHGEEGKASYSYHAGTNIRSFSSYDELYQALSRLTRHRNYLAQKGIHLLKYKGRRFDLRVMVQQSPARRWETTGVIGRVAAPGKAVTNVHNGGKLRPVGSLLAPHAGPREKEKAVRDLRSLGLSVAKQLHRRYPGIKEIGLDVAMDNKLCPWILEVNTCPDPFIFRKLKDKSIYGRIYRYAKAYGRL